MGWKIEVLIVFIKYRNKDIEGAERKLLDPYLGKWVYSGMMPRVIGKDGDPHSETL